MLISKLKFSPSTVTLRLASLRYFYNTDWRIDPRTSTGDVGNFPQTQIDGIPKMPIKLNFAYHAAMCPLIL